VDVVQAAAPVVAVAVATVAVVPAASARTALREPTTPSDFRVAKVGRLGQSDPRPVSRPTGREIISSIARHASLWQHSAMDMREILMIIGDDQPDVEAVTVSGPVWLWRAEPPAKGAWYFLTISDAASAAIRHQADGRSNGWGSIKVNAIIGSTSWQTSLFPSKNVGGFLLPIKADVRKKEHISEGSEVEALITVV
jgi:Domain of unknown function (DUF1905)